MGAGAAAELTMSIAREASKVSPRFDAGGFAAAAYLVRFSPIKLVGIYGLLLGCVGMEEGDCGDNGGAAAPARQVGAPTRRADFSGELHRFIAIDSGHSWNYYFRACFVISTRLLLPAVLNY